MIGPRAFNSLADFGLHLAEVAVSMPLALHHGLDRIGLAVENDAKEQIGHYQEAAGPFPAWDQLAPSTEEDKERKGYALNAPLLREGDLRESYSHEVAGLEVGIGSPMPEAEWQELGTPTIQPRPVLGPAAIHQDKLIRETIGLALVSGFLGAKAIDYSLGYRFRLGGPTGTPE